MAYSDKVLDHYNNPRNVGSLDKSAGNVSTGMVGAPECGDVMKLQIKVNDASGIIEDAEFKTFGCGSRIGHSWLAAERREGKTVADGQGIRLGRRADIRGPEEHPLSQRNDDRLQGIAHAIRLRV